MKDFFEKVKGKVDEGVSAISSKSKETIELAKRRSQLRALKKEKGEKINALGRLVYDKLRNDEYSEESIREFYSEIDELDRKITGVENEIKQVQIMTSTGSVAKCECDTDLSSNQKFCASCGKNVKEILAEAMKPAEGMKHCQSCGTEIKETAKFCGKCGAKQTDTDENK